MNERALVSVTAQIVPTEDVTLPLTTGNLVYACFLDQIVRPRDHALADSLHDRAPLKPFTVSALRGRFAFQNSSRVALAGRPYAIRLTGLSQAVCGLLTDLVESPMEELRFADHRWHVLNTTMDPAVHPLADRGSYEALYRRHIVRPPSARGLTLWFASPTTFRVRAVHVPLPLPFLVFSNLAARWNAFAPVELGREVGAHAERLMVLSRYRLRTAMTDFGRYRLVGFVGDCEYLIRPAGDELYPRIFRLLAEFACYAGVGYKTTMGLGQVHPPRRGAES